MGSVNIRTDLALEARERVSGDDAEISGVVLEEDSIDGEDISITRVKVINEHGEKVMGKPIGNYITIESESLRMTDDMHNLKLSGVLADILEELVDGISEKSVMVVGLGNRDATPDALGPRVASDIYVGENVYAVAPGVMAQTGMETAAYVCGLAGEVKPDVVIAIDALAARSTKRLNTTIQISDTGICPGSGVGNHRKEISRKTLGIPVIAIGVPTVVDAATIVSDVVDSLVSALSQSGAFDGLRASMEELSDMEKYQLIKELLEPAGGDMYVTPKDIDENIKNLGYIVSDGINLALNQSV